jgi:NAD(P)H-hydrate epimerase
LGFTPKLSFYLQENNTYVGQLHLLDIGLHRNYSLENSARFELLTHEKIPPLLKARELYSHKGNYGHALLIAGNIGKMGACVLAARGALRSGLGLLSCFVPVTENSILQTAVPEAMTITEKLNPLSFNSIAIGPGIGVGTTQVELLEELLNTYSKPIVMDADALTILSNHTHLLKKVPSLSIFTPHIGEFIRLFGETDNDFDRMELAIKKSKELNIIIILKGQHTLVATPFEPYFINTSGNPGMAKGGAGDVLTGVILGLLAQGYNSIEASIIGVYLHGKAGDLAAEKHTYYGMTTGDLIDSLRLAWKELIVS